MSAVATYCPPHLEAFEGPLPEASVERVIRVTCNKNSSYYESFSKSAREFVQDRTLRLWRPCDNPKKFEVEVAHPGPTSIPNERDLCCVDEPLARCFVDDPVLRAFLKAEHDLCKLFYCSPHRPGPREVSRNRRTFVYTNNERDPRALQFMQEQNRSRELVVFIINEDLMAALAALSDRERGQPAGEPAPGAVGSPVAEDGIVVFITRSERKAKCYVLDKPWGPYELFDTRMCVPIGERIFLKIKEA